MAVGHRGTPVAYEPKRNNRFTLEFPTELGIEYWKVQTSGRPSIQITDTEIPFLNTSFWVAGRYTFDTIDITFIDTIGPSTSQELWNWLTLQAEAVTGRMGYAEGYKKDLILKSLDPVLNEVEKWVLHGCMITNIKFGDNNAMDDDGLQMVSVTIRYDYGYLAY
jgi:hypothetical protein